MSLTEIQSSFAAALIDRQAAVPAQVAVAALGPQSRRFNVYRNNVFHSLTSLLSGYFPVVSRLVGPEFFASLARAYIEACPPQSPILSRYGDGLPSFIEGYPPAADAIYLADVARLELIRLKAFHAADAAAIDMSDLADLPAVRIRNLAFELAPATALFASRWPAVSIWWTNTFDNEVVQIDLGMGSEQALVTRSGLDVAVVRLPPGASRFIGAVSGGSCLQQAVEHTIEVFPDFDVQACLQMLLNSRALSGFS